METKQCKKCKEEINKKAKKCPKCGSKQGFPIWLIVLIALILIGIIAAAGVDSDSSSSSKNKVPENIEYVKVTKDALDDALEENAAAAKDRYNKKYVEVTGKLGTIDSDLKYISLMSATDEWDIIGINCRIKNDEQREIVKSLKSNQNITIKGQITDVGEVLDYYIDIIEIIK